MSTLLLVSERTGEEWQVWPKGSPIPAGCVAEGGSYLFELRDAVDGHTAEFLIDEIPLEALRTAGTDRARWRWQPGFNAGTVEVELRVPGQSSRRFEIVTDPDRRKLTRDDFDAMVSEILSDTAALFSLGGFRKSIARGSGTRAPPVARLEYLRSRIAELESVVTLIARAPRRTLVGDDMVLPYHRASRAAPAEILRSFRSGRILREIATPGRLPSQLRGFLPERIHLRHRRSSLDLPEHRQMAACLRSWAEWLGLAAEWIERERSLDAESPDGTSVWPARCRRLSRRISRMTLLPPFAEASAAPARLMMSSLFRRDPAYRRFYTLWQEISLGIAGVFGDFLNLPLARTFDLYELWCFLRLVRAGIEAFGAAGTHVEDLFTTDCQGGVTIPAGAMTVSVGHGWKLCFQKHYEEFWIGPERRGSFSRGMTPDIVLLRDADTNAPAARLIVLDAKYRIDEGLNDALSSIHTYRDALVQEAESGHLRGIVTAAYLLTPHVPVMDDEYRSTPMPARLFHPVYRSTFRFGAVTLRPRMTMAEVAAALELIIADATRPDKPHLWTS